MPRWLTALVSWQLARALTPDQRLAAVGDLTEDFARQVNRRGVISASLWTLSEAASLARAYRHHQRATPPRRSSTMLISSLIEDLRLAARRLASRPAASAAAVITLAFGIGAASATWSLLDRTLLNPLAVREPDALVVVGQRLANERTYYSHTYPNLREIRERGVFEQVAAAGSPGTEWTELTDIGGGVEPRGVFYVSHDFFDVLGVPMQIGTDFHPDDDRSGASIRVILADRFWRGGFGRDPNIVGRALTIAGKRAIVAGVAPAAFRGIRLAESPDLYLPLNVIEDITGVGMNYFALPISKERGSPTSFLTIVGRLRSGMDSTEAAARLSTFEDARAPVVMIPLATSVIPETARGGMREFSRLLGITVSLLLLAAFLSVAMLLLFRAEARRAEFALCLALGASRGRLARGLALEGLLLSLTAAVLALPVAALLFALTRQFQLPGRIRLELLELSLDVPVYLAAVLLAIAGAVSIGAVAAGFGVSARMADSLRERHALAGAGRRRARAGLVAAQVAIALVLLVGAGLFTRSLMAALSLNPGFETGRVLTGSLSLSRYGYTAPHAAAFFETLATRLRHNPAIESIALMRSSGGMTPSGRITVNGQPRQFPSLVSYVAVDDSYFDTMGTTLLRGRRFTPADSEETAAIVSESFGRMLANGGDPLGHRIRASSTRPGQPAAEAVIVGVVSDVITNVAVLEPLVKYFPLAPETGTSATVVLRATTSADAATRETIAAIRELDPTLELPLFRTMKDRLAAQMGPQELGAAVLGGLGVIAALLTLVGTYVVAETMASARRRELGIRAALGATRQQLGTMILSHTVKLVGAGVVIGLVVAWLLASSIRPLLYRVDAFDPTTLTVTVVAILGLALAVSLRPAVGATRVNLAALLRDE